MKIVVLLFVVMSLAAMNLMPSEMEPVRTPILIQTEEFDMFMRYVVENGFDIAGVDLDQGIIEVVVSAEEKEMLNSAEISFTIREPFQRSSLRNLQDYIHPDEAVERLFAVQEAYPDIAMVVPISDALWEGGIVYAIKISDNVLTDEDEPVFLLDAQHHAREVMTPEIAMDAVEYITSNYGSDQQVTRWVDELEIWVVPVVNPDGVNYMFSSDSWWRKNRNPQCAVDLNRNYPATWNTCMGSSGDCYNNLYRGSDPGSEFETQSMLALMDEIRPIFNLSYHSYGTLIIWPIGCGPTTDYQNLWRIGGMLNLNLEDDLGNTGRYRMGTAYETVNYPVDGSSSDEPYARYGTYAYTVEVNTLTNGGFQPDYATWRDITVLRQRNAWSFFMDYLLDELWVTGTVRDSLTGEPLQGVSFSIDEMPLDPIQSGRTTDHHGRYFFFPLPGSVSNVTFTHPGYEPFTFSFTVDSSPVVKDILLEKGYYSVDTQIRLERQPVSVR